MPLLDDTRLEKHATAVVDRFFSEKVALTDGVADVAEQDNLNPEQVKRLVEAVNNMTFLRKFDGADDRMAASEFQPADANGALSRMLDSAKELTEAPATPAACCMDTGDLPVTRPDAPELNPLEGEEHTDVPEPKIKGDAVIMKLRKTAELLRDQEYQARCELTDTFQTLATSFSRVNGVPFETFEKDAFYKWGERAAPFLNLLRGSLRMPQAEYDHSSMRKVARVIDSSSPTMRRFNELMLHSENASKAELGIKRVQGYLGRLEN
jgi:hypothetical protein